MDLVMPSAVQTLNEPVLLLGEDAVLPFGIERVSPSSWFTRAANTDNPMRKQSA
ncbi:MAG: hypothetical protein WKF84_19460 [Pyrinomonadaceae bacterium]